MTWDYQQDKVLYKDLQDLLDLRGKECWELVSAFMYDPDETTEVVCLFKMRREE